MRSTSRVGIGMAGAAMALALAAGAGSLPAASPAVEAAILDLEQQRVQAMLRGDVQALSRILADDLTYTHSSGTVDTKASFLDAISSGQLKYKAFDRSDLRVRAYGNAAVVTGRAAVQVDVAQKPSSPTILFTDVYVRQPEGRWQMVAWQSTRLPDPSPAP